MTLNNYLTHSLLAALIALTGAVGAATAADSDSGQQQTIEEASDSSGSSSSSGSAETFEESTEAELAEIESILQEELKQGDKEGSRIAFVTEESRAELVSKDQPDWLNISPEESLIQHKYVVASQLYFSAEETQGDLDQAMREAVDRYVNAYLGDDKASMLIRHDSEFIRSQLMTDQFDEIWNVKEYNKNMYRRHALVNFNDSFRAHLDTEWRNVMQTSRLLTTALGAFGVLSLLAVAFSYLRLDTATQGAYSGRLKFLSAVAILALAAAGALFANVNADWLRWM